MSFKYYLLISVLSFNLFGINQFDEIKGARNSELFKKIERSAAMIKINYRREDGATVERTGSGVLIDAQTVLTAAHLFQAGGDTLWVEIQGTKFFADMNRVEITANYKKQKFDTYAKGDVALIRLNQPIPGALLGAGIIRPMPFVPKEHYEMDEKEVYLAGFGSELEDRTKDEHREFPLEKMQLKKYVAYASSEEKYADGGLGWIVGAQLGVGRPKGSSGLPSGGDSGGPVIKVLEGEPYLMGTLSGSIHINGWFDWVSALHHFKVETQTSFRVPAEGLAVTEILPAPVSVPAPENSRPVEVATAECRNPLPTWYAATWGESAVHYGYGDTAAEASHESLEDARDSARRPFSYGTKVTQCACISAAFNPTTGDYFFTTGDRLDGLSENARALCEATRRRGEGGCTYITGRCRSENDGWTTVDSGWTTGSRSGYSTSSSGSFSYSYSRSYSSSGSSSTPPPRGFFGRRLRK